MKKLAGIAALFLMLINHTAQAEDMNLKRKTAEETCQTMLDKCKPIAKNLSAPHADACEACLTYCKEAQALCANEKAFEKKAQENLQSASVHYLHCKNKCSKMN